LGEFGECCHALVVIAGHGASVVTNVPGDAALALQPPRYNLSQVHGSRSAVSS
jgi:hypothetical protein